MRIDDRKVNGRVLLDAVDPVAVRRFAATPGSSGEPSHCQVAPVRSTKILKPSALDTGVITVKSTTIT